jgi:transposase
LHARLRKALAALAALNERRRGKRRFTQLSTLQGAAAILTRYRVQRLVRLSYEEQVHEGLVRRYGNRPATVRVEREVQVTASVDQAAVAVAVRRLGWRVYVTNAPAEQLSLVQAVLAYRSEYLIERDMGRLKGKPLSLTPMCVERADHATGLIRLLSIGLRMLTLLEFVVCRRLAVGQTTLWSTPRPTAECLLEAFQDLTLTIIREGRRCRYHLTPLSRVQRRILALLNCPVDIYSRLCPDSHQPP